MTARWRWLRRLLLLSVLTAVVLVALRLSWVSIHVVDGSSMMPTLEPGNWMINLPPESPFALYPHPFRLAIEPGRLVVIQTARDPLSHFRQAVRALKGGSQHDEHAVVKRVMAVSGQTVQLQQQSGKLVVTINGQPIGSAVAGGECLGRYCYDLATEADWLNPESSAEIHVPKIGDRIIVQQIDNQFVAELLSRDGEVLWRSENTCEFQRWFLSDAMDAHCPRRVSEPAFQVRPFNVSSTALQAWLPVFNGEATRGEWWVDDDYALVLGDNRATSYDSRYFGLVPMRRIESVLWWAL